MNDYLSSLLGVEVQGEGDEESDVDDVEGAVVTGEGDGEDEVVGVVVEGEGDDEEEVDS